MLTNSRFIVIIFFYLFSYFFAQQTNAQTISGTVNSYTSVTNVYINSVTVSNASSFNVGDYALLIFPKFSF